MDLGPKAKGACHLCGKPGVVCAKCLSTHYCSKAHQRADWKRHKELCRPLFEEVQKPGEVPQLIACQNIKKGQAVMISRPIVIGPSGMTPVCLGCMRPEIYDAMSNQCSRCGWPLCLDCDNAGAPAHKTECQAMHEAGFHFDPNVPRRNWKVEFQLFGLSILVLRCLLLPENQLKRLTQHKYLVESRPLIPNIPLMEALVLLCANTIRDTLKIKQFDINNIIHVGFLAMRSTFTCAPLKHDTGAFEPRAAYAVHVSDLLKASQSCLPNLQLVTTSVDPNNVYAVSLRDIPAGESLSIDKYCLSSMSTVQRQAVMVTKCLDPCSCHRCMDPSELGLYLGSLKCQKCLAQYGKDCMIVPISTENILKTDWVCQSCRRKTSSFNYIQVLKEMKERNDKAVQAARGGHLEKLVQFIEEHAGPKGILHPNHQIILCAKDAFCQEYYERSAKLDSIDKLGSKFLRRFHLYSHNLVNRRSGFWDEELTWPFFRAKIVSSRSISCDWALGKMSKKKAEERMRSELREIQSLPRPSVVSYNQQSGYEVLLSEILKLQERLTRNLK